MFYYKAPLLCNVRQIDTLALLSGILLTDSHGPGEVEGGIKIQKAVKCGAETSRVKSET